MRLLNNGKFQSCRLRQGVPGDANTAFAGQEKEIEDTSTKLTYHNCNRLLYSPKLDSCVIELYECLRTRLLMLYTMDDGLLLIHTYGVRKEQEGRKEEEDGRKDGSLSWA